MTKKGFSLIELLVVMTIAATVFSAIYVTYTKLYSGAKQLAKQNESNIENIMSTEIIRIDFSSAGIGIPTAEEGSGVNKIYPALWDNGSLVINSTFDRMNTSTHGVVMLKCLTDSNVCAIMNETDSRVDKNAPLRVIDSVTNKKIDYSLGAVNASKVRYAIGYPYSDVTNIRYYLSVSCGSDGVKGKIADKCAPNTFSLCRGESVIAECAAGFEIFGGYAENGDITYERLADITKDNIEKLFKLRRLVMYVLVQEGQFDKKFRFTSDTMSRDMDFDLKDDPMDQIAFSIPEGGKNYRWNIISADARTVNIGSKYAQ